jgi:hypothetical protein
LLRHCGKSTSEADNEMKLLSTAVASPISKTIVDYRQDVKRHPAFFLWKVLKSKN